LNGSGEDPDGDPLFYLWRQVSGEPRVEIFNEANPVASFNAPSNLTSDTNLVFELTVYDNRGLNDSSTTTVTILKSLNNDVQLSGPGSTGGFMFDVASSTPGLPPCKMYKVGDGFHKSVMYSSTNTRYTYIVPENIFLQVFSPDKLAHTCDGLNNGQEGFLVPH
jgi:hypothetical protein